TMERAAQMHLLARAAGELKAIDPKLGREAHDWRHNPKMISMTFDYYVRRTISKDGSSIVPTR
ncbi:MAG: hypothetical protein ACKVHL_00470, partial [Rhodospirillales bacterium]